MNILLICKIFPPITGGSGRWAFEIYRRLANCDVTVVAGDHPAAAEFDSRCELPINRLDLTFPDCGFLSVQGYRDYRNSMLGCLRVSKKHSFDVIHAGSLLPDGWLVRKLAKKLRVPYAVYLHGEETCFASQSRQLKWMGRKVLKDAALIVANSQNTFRLIDEFWQIPTGKATILNPGVDCDLFRPAARDTKVRESLDWNDRPVLLTVGRLQARKGQETLLRAMPELLKKHPELLYCIVGDGDQRERLHQVVAELKLEESVQFRHECSDETLAQCYQQADLFVLPNREIDGDIEGFGMVLLEAQACGTPVVAGMSGGTAETMQPGITGELVDCRSHELLTEKLTELLADPGQLEVMGTAAREWVVEKFDWDSLSKQAAGLFLSSQPSREAALTH